jgi:hypothetical protein
LIGQCSIAGCDRKHLAKGLCLMHYKRKRRRGSTDSPTRKHAVVREGDVFDRLTVVRCASLRPQKWLCRCICGNEATVFGCNLQSGHTTSCGCRMIELATRHGRSETKEYRAWIAMRTRCTLPNTPYFKDYGGRGIRVCDRWESFDLFLSDMGPRPSARHSVERSDVNGNYEPSNCCWAIPKTQARNRRCTVYVTVDGQSLALAEAVERSGLNYRTVHHRIFSRGWSAADALSKAAATKFSPHGGAA